jgi:hypothetical protein
VRVPLLHSPDSSKGERPAHIRQTEERYLVGRPFLLPLRRSVRDALRVFRRALPRHAFLRSSKAEPSPDKRECTARKRIPANAER